MKAIDILRIIAIDNSITEQSTIVDISAENGLKTWFGESAKHKKGTIEINDFETAYWAVWDNQTTIGLITRYHADAVVTTDDETIYLYKIES